MSADLVELLQLLRKVQMRFFSHVPEELRCPSGFDKLVKEDAQDVDHLAILPILQPTIHGLSAEVSPHILCRVLFQSETFGSLVETLCPFDTPHRLPPAGALGIQGLSLAAPKGAFSILVRLHFHTRSPPDLKNPIGV